MLSWASEGEFLFMATWNHCCCVELSWAGEVEGEALLVLTWHWWVLTCKVQRAESEVYSVSTLALVWMVREYPILSNPILPCVAIGPSLIICLVFPPADRVTKACRQVVLILFSWIKILVTVKGAFKLQTTT